MQSAYQSLETTFRRFHILKEVTALLDWDMQTMMPSGGADSRSEHMATLEVMCHDILADPKISQLLAEAEAERDHFNAWQQANINEMRRQWIHTAALPVKLVESLTRSANQGMMQWREARQASNFSLVKGALAKLVDLKREAAYIKADKLGVSPYEALMDEFEPGLTTQLLDRIFATLEQKLPGLLQRIMNKQATEPEVLPLQGDFSQKRQKMLAEKLMGILGFDFNHGRLDISLHPFCGGVPDDVRITTRYNEEDFTSALMGVLHETGHALYELGLPGDWRYQPVGLARGMAFHESQSLMIEMQVCRNPAFLAFLLPEAKVAFAGEGSGWIFDNFVRHYHRVRPGYIRVDADEVTYPLHVIIRYRLERDVIAGKLSIDDIPEAWNAAYEELLGLTPPNDRLGCLQDIHWYVGAWGYFPTYTLGALTAAQLFASFREAVPSYQSDFKKGEFSELVSWLRANVHVKGSSLSSDHLLREATGLSLDPTYFIKHLEQRYCGI